MKKYENDDNNDINYDARDGDLTRGDVVCFEKYWQRWPQAGRPQKGGQSQRQAPLGREETSDQGTESNEDCCSARNEASPHPAAATQSTLLTFSLQQFNVDVNGTILNRCKIKPDDSRFPLCSEVVCRAIVQCSWVYSPTRLCRLYILISNAAKTFHYSVDTNTDLVDQLIQHR